MKIKIYTTILILFLVLNGGCKKEEFELPSINLLEITIPEGFGVKLKFEVKDVSGIKSAVVIFRKNSVDNPATNINKVIDLNKNGVAEIDIDGYLYKNCSYSAVIEYTINNTKYYSNSITFESKGYKVPVVKSVSPKVVYIGDTVTIKGLNLSLYTLAVNENTKLVTYKSDTLLKFTVPDISKSVNPELRFYKVYYYSPELTLTNAIQFAPPQISRIIPETGTFRDTLSIIGNDFDSNTSRIQVLIGGVTTKVISCNRKEVKAIIPDDISKSDLPVTVKSFYQEVSSPTNFQLKKVELISMPTSGGVGAKIRIAARNLNPTYYKNKVYFDGNQATVSSIEKDTITVEVPNIVYPKKKASITIAFADISSPIMAEFAITDKWVKVSNAIPFSAMGDYQFNIGNNAYFVAQDYPSYGSVSLAKFEPTNLSWTSELIPFQLGSGFVVASGGSKAYIYNPRKIDNFIEYDPATKIWTKRCNFPGADRDFSTLFYVDGMIYLGIGYNVMTDASFFDLYRYDPVNDKWQKMCDYPKNNDNPFQRIFRKRAFIIDSNAYLCSGADNTGDKEFYMYNATSNTWIKRSDVYDAINYASVFAYNSKGYVCFGNGVSSSGSQHIWEYDPKNDRWSYNSKVGLVDRMYGFTFIANGKVYAGGYTSYTGSETASDLFELQGEL